MAKWNKNGEEALKAVKMGVPTGKRCKLSPLQQAKMKETIIASTPLQMGVGSHLWDRKAVSALAFKLFRIKLPLSTTGYYLQRFGMTAQRPVKRNPKQNSALVRKWVEEEFPAIKARCEEENGIIFWGDETGIQNESNYIKGYAPIGKTPVLPFANDKLRVNMVAAISNQGRVVFTFYRDTMNAEKFIDFMKKLVKTANKKVFFIVDNLKVHHAIIVKEWLDEHKNEIEIFYIPAYSPERNPDEYLNRTLKTDMAKRGYSKTIDELEAKAVKAMNKMRWTNNYVVKCFGNSYVLYAA
ncbi:hypothetical protein FACS1894120_5350 [Clostridia bacterium]|nr:hypothetical protein FACS1894120_5350 [Clostridia bacterium]